jgi:class 3 adenylate cyclase
MTVVSETSVLTVVELDLVAYQTIATALEESLGPTATLMLNEQLCGFVANALECVGGEHVRSFLLPTGDGAIVGFGSPSLAVLFAAHLHELTRRHNRDRTATSAKRLFRIGVATGDVSTGILADGRPEIGGIAVGRAVRLEAKANPGEVLADDATYAALPSALCSHFGKSEVITGKRDERFIAHRAVFNPDATQDAAEVDRDEPWSRAASSPRSAIDIPSVD